MANSKLLTKDDYWAIWLGGALLVGGFLAIWFGMPKDFSITQSELRANIEKEANLSPIKTIEWYQYQDQLKSIKGSSQTVGKFFKSFTGKPMSWNKNPLKGLGFGQQNKEDLNQKELVIQVENQMAQAREYFEIARSNNFEDENKNLIAKNAIEKWHETKIALSSLKKKISGSNAQPVPWLLALFLGLALLFGLGGVFMGIPLPTFIKGFGFVFLLATLSYLLAAQSDMKAIGFGYAAWAIILGLLISNTVGTPKFVHPALTTEYYIKTGLVILGAEILLSKILAIGLPGIFVAWIVTPIVLVSTFWFGQKVLKISSKTLNMTISADMSVCGVSAAVATAAACKASKEELTVAIGLSMIFTSVMMIVLPAFINYMGIPEVLGGAWIGGTIDATGAVVAAGAFLGEKALSVAATIKMIQNVLIGLIAFGVAVYFSTKVDKDSNTTVGWGEIWNRFPKFILGFIGASVIFSLAYLALGDDGAYAIIDQGVIASFTKNIRAWLFCLAFVSIGLSINFKELRKHFIGGKPLILYLCGQTFNLCLTLLMAYIMFYVVFPDITANI